MELSPLPSSPQPGPIIVITGATSGLGRATLLSLYASSPPPSTIYLLSRNPPSPSLIAQLSSFSSPTLISSAPSITHIPTDLTSLPSVCDAATKILSSETKLDILIANAGVAAVPPGRTQEGYEVHFGVNFLGHALLIRKLMGLLERGKGRVVNVGSEAFRGAWGLGLEWVEQGGKGGWLEGCGDVLMVRRWMRYAESKLAGVVYVRELARRVPGVVSVTVNPGFVETEMVKGMRWCDRWGTRMLGWWMGGMVSPEEGARNQIWAATVEREELVNGGLYEPVGRLYEDVGRVAKDPRLGERLWEWTEDELEKWL